MEKKTLFLLCFLLLLFIQSSFARISPSSLKSNSPSRAAEKLIRQLNLLPKDAVPVTEKNINSSFFSLSSEEKIVEKSFRFPDIHEEEKVGGGNNGSSSVEDLGHHAGYYKIQHSYAARMFYFFFESRNNKKNDPVVIWLTGGPGCSSELALFYENGPFTISDNLSLRWNNYGWDKVSNLIYVDQPTGTGFSYSSDQRDLRQNEEGVSNDLYDFLQAFFAKHPEYVNNDFYITGESYAGHYIPAFASRVQKGNKAKEGIHINLKGIAIGNGLTNPAIQYKAYADFALSTKLIQQSDYENINELVPDCESATDLCATNGGEDCITAYSSCTAIFGRILDIAGNLNYYDIRKQCEGSLCYDFSNAENFLNERSVRSALGVGDIDFVSCSPAVHEAMEEDWMKNLEVGIPALLEDGIKVLIYAGEYDLICNWLGNWRWVHAMEWSGKQEFAGARNVSFNVDSKEAGLLKSHGSLSFLKVHDAGHMVPMDQPKASLEMLRRFTQGKLADPATTTSTSWRQHMITIL